MQVPTPKARKAPPTCDKAGGSAKRCEKIFVTQEFNHLVLRDTANWVELVVRDGDRPCVRIEASREMLDRLKTVVKDNTLYVTLEGGFLERLKDAFTTSLTRQTARIELDVIGLETIDAFGMVHVDTSHLTTAQPEVILRGPAALWGAWPPRGGAEGIFRSIRHG